MSESSVNADPCPCEMDDVSKEVTAVLCSERLIKVVALRSHIKVLETGKVELLSTAISQDDIEGRRDRNGEPRSVSTFREGLTPAKELERRAKALNQVPEWCDDPVLAIVDTEILRGLTDNAGRREVCVYAEPTDESDRLGACPTHAGIKRSQNPPIQKSRLSWAVLRSAVAQKFGEFRHACTDTPVTADSIE